jgi:hypothetical protein
MLGLPSPVDCQLHLLTVDLIAPAIFEPENEPGLLSRGGVAEVRFKLPNLPQVLGLGMTTQWLEWSQFATSNAIEWSVAPAPATLAFKEKTPASPMLSRRVTPRTTELYPIPSRLAPLRFWTVQYAEAAKFLAGDTALPTEFGTTMGTWAVATWSVRSKARTTRKSERPR